MKCPFCNIDNSKVIDSRGTDDKQSIRRRRECISCGNRFTTYEKVEQIPLLVIKKDGTRQSFNRTKLFEGLVRACEGRPISIDEMEKIIDNIEAEINQTMIKEVDSTAIGAKVMDALKEVDEVAYVRFASVYRNFKDINTFMEELKRLMEEKESIK